MGAVLHAAPPQCTLYAPSQLLFLMEPVLSFLFAALLAVAACHGCATAARGLALCPVGLSWVEVLVLQLLCAVSRMDFKGGCTEG